MKFIINNPKFIMLDDLLTQHLLEYYTQVGADVKLMSMVKAVNTEAPIWYAQVNIKS